MEDIEIGRPLMGFVLMRFEKELVDIGLFRAIWATQYGIVTNLGQLFAILEIYNSTTGTFFTSDSTIRLALHEMLQVFRLPIGDILYEKYFSRPKELETLLAKDNSWYLTFLGPVLSSLYLFRLI